MENKTIRTLRDDGTYEAQYIIDGQLYTPMQDAYVGEGNADGYYQARARLEDGVPHGDRDEGEMVMLRWKILEDWNFDYGEDGACDWDKPEIW